MPNTLQDALMPKTMRAYVLEETADGVKGQLNEALSTQLLPKHPVLIRVHYASINYKDSMIANGQGGMVRQYPHVGGVDASGVVEQDESGTWAVGSKVVVTGYGLGVASWGAYAEYIRVPADWVYPLAEGLSLKEAMILGTAGFTAMQAILGLERNGLQPGQGPVLVTGASGGVGSVAVQILALRGYQVWAVSGKPDFANTLKGWGAETVLSREEVSDASGKVLLKERWAAAIDNVGGEMLESVIRSTLYDGSVAAIGLVGDHKLNTTVFPFILRGVNLLGIDSVQCSANLRQQVWALLGKDGKPPHLDSIAQPIHLADLPEALQAIGAGNARGRYLVQMHEG